MIGCTTTGQAYLPHTSRVFHANKNCVGCYDPNPIVFQTVQAAANSGGIAPCSLCVTAKDFAVKQQGYTSTNFSTMPGQIQASSGSSNPPASSTAHMLLQSIGKGLQKGLQNYIDKAPARRAARQQRLHQFNVENQMRRQTSIMQQQLDNQERQQRLLPNPAPFIPIQRRLYEKQLYLDSLQNQPSRTYIPPVKKYEYNPIQSPFKGKGLLDERYSNPPVKGYGILGN